MPNTEPRIESVLEVIDTSTRQRSTIYREIALFEAPNWSRDGKTFIYNKEGRLFKLPVTGGTPVMIETGFADRNNNDHGISPDGKQLVISHHSAEHDGASIIYTLPVEGGTPRQITARGPSYWHGWSPDGKTLAYVGGRGNESDYDIYTISINGGEETRLTNTPGLDDGPDYSADGSHIYFNSYRSGVMQIWRMNADGGNPVQMVHSPHSDWFPHPSPDGRKIVFIRYLKDQQEAHPFGQDVKLMQLNLENSEVSDLTDVFFGGQGTINVPSWSPDSLHVAFVSYREL